jgi:hypothetical protein
MVYRNIKHEDFDQVLQSLGDDPAILEHGIPSADVQVKQSAPWYANLNRKWMELNLFKDSVDHPVYRSAPLIGLIGFISLITILTYVAIQIDDIKAIPPNNPDIALLKRELKELRVQLNELNGLIEDQHEDILLGLEEAQTKKVYGKIDHQGVRPIKNDPEEIELKKWRHLGIGKNKAGAYVMLHDGHQSILFTKNQSVKPSWRVADFDPHQTILLGPGDKRLVLVSP